jgi:exodeoxyribonuclease VII large subunit
MSEIVAVIQLADGTAAVLRMDKTTSAEFTASLKAGRADKALLLAKFRDAEIVRLQEELDAVHARIRQLERREGDIRVRFPLEASAEERHERLLARGYVVVRDANARVLTEAAAIDTGAPLDLEFHDGRVSVVAAQRKSRIRKPAKIFADPPFAVHGAGATLEVSAQD